MTVLAKENCRHCKRPIHLEYDLGRLTPWLHDEGGWERCLLGAEQKAEPFFKTFCLDCGQEKYKAVSDGRSFHLANLSIHCPPGAKRVETEKPVLSQPDPDGGTAEDDLIGQLAMSEALIHDIWKWRITLRNTDLNGLKKVFQAHGRNVNP